MAEKKRKMALSQLDEIWAAAKSKWGDPGRRHPAPNQRFEPLRHLLNEIESLFDEDTSDDDLFGDNIEIGMNVSAVKRKKKKPTRRGSRKLYSEDDDEDEDETPF